MYLSNIKAFHPRTSHFLRPEKEVTECDIVDWNLHKSMVSVGVD